MTVPGINAAAMRLESGPAHYLPAMIWCHYNMLKFGQRACTHFKFPSNTSRISRFQSTKVNASELFEEERLPWYSHDQFYPVRTGEVLDSSFKVIGKLGYGAYSTVWLCRDIRHVWRSSPSPFQSLIMHAQRTKRRLCR
jgi:hypothetical protein